MENTRKAKKCEGYIQVIRMFYKNKSIKKRALMALLIFNIRLH